jgi:hypothetical protein
MAVGQIGKSLPGVKDAAKRRTTQRSYLARDTIYVNAHADSASQESKLEANYRAFVSVKRRSSLLNAAGYRVMELRVRRQKKLAFARPTAVPPTVTVWPPAEVYR